MTIPKRARVIVGGINNNIGESGLHLPLSLYFTKHIKTMTIGSCFSGIGGELVAASMLGWDVKFFCEKNPFGNRVLSYWYPNAKNYEDITTADFSEWRGRVDVLTGGFPCQPFSYAGRRRGAEDDRYLWPAMHNAIDEIQPTWVVAENVAGILTFEHSRQTGSGVSQRAKKNTNYTNYTNGT